MSVRCATCSEEFLGAVNRCWKCGSYVTLNLEAFQTPPVRRAPVVLRPKAKPEAVSSAAGQSTANPLGALPGARRRGNPFAAQTNEQVFIPTDSEAMANQDAAEKGVWIGLAVAVAAWLLAYFFPLAAPIVALVAIGLSIWGLSSRRKALAIAVIVLSVLGFLAGGVQCIRWGYNMLAPEFQFNEVEEEEMSAA